MMVFNPIFIDPQKFLSPPEISGVKKNKFTYLFSDIIKNSLGTKKNENQNLKTDAKQSGESISVVQISPNVSNTENLILKTEEELVLELTNIISMINNLNPTAEAKPKIILSEFNGKSEIVTDAKSIASALHEIIELVNKYGFSVEEGNIIIPPAETGSAEINKNLKLNDSQAVQKILSSITQGKQLNISLQVGDSLIDVEVSDLINSNKPSELVPEGNLKPAAELIETDKPFVKTEVPILKDSSISPTADLVKDQTGTTVNINSVKVEPEAFKLVVSLKTKNVLNSDVVKVTKTGAVPKTDILPAEELIKKIKFQLDDVVGKSSKAEQINKPINTNANEVEIPKPTIVKLEDQPLKNISGSKLIQSIKRLDNKMLRPDFIPKEIKFNPSSVDDIKNEKFELFNLNSAVRAIKSMSSPAAEFTTKNESKSTNKTFSVNKIDSSGEITDSKKTEISKSDLTVKSNDVLTSLKSKSNIAEVKELKEFISSNKSSHLLIKIIPKNETINIEENSTAGLDKQVKPSESSNIEIKQSVIPNEKFEIDFEKFSAAVKEKSGNKEIQKFVELHKEFPKAKISIEAAKQIPIEQPELKQHANLQKSASEMAEVVSIKQTVQAGEKLDKPLVKSSEANTAEQSKEQKIESASKPDQSANGSENKNSENKQAANNNYSKTNETESVKVNILPSDESFKESLKSVNTVANLETASANSSGDIVSLPKELAGNMREVKAADIYKELYKLIDKKEKQSISLQVIPKMLGKIKIVVDIIDQMVQTKIEVETESAKQLLQNNMEMLKQSLNQSGIQLNSYTISLSNPNNKNFKPFSAKKKTSGEEDLENNDFDNTPISGKKMGYNTYEYLI